MARSRCARPERKPERRRHDVREKVAAADQDGACPSCCRRSSPSRSLTPLRVISLMVSSDAMSLRTLTEIGDKQVSRDPDGQRRRQITIAAPPARSHCRRRQKLNSYGLSIAQRPATRCAETSRFPAAPSSRQGPAAVAHPRRIDASRDLNESSRDDERDVRFASRTWATPRTGRAAHSRSGTGDKPRCSSTSRAHGRNTVAYRSVAAAAVDRPVAAQVVRLTMVRDDSKFITRSISSLEDTSSRQPVPRWW